MKKSIEIGIPAFIEASVVDIDLELIITEAAVKGVFLAPSCTLFFHPAIKKIRKILLNNELGKISNFLYHSGQYLPDWHTYEDVSQFYVSKKETGGAREIVPFELTWITLLMGFPLRIVGFHKNSIMIKGAEEIDETYNILMDYGESIFNLSVDVVSRYATRRLLINGDKKQLFWDWDDNIIRVFNPQVNSWEEVKYEINSAEKGYNKNITEQMYIDEIEAFLKAVEKEIPFPNTLEHDHKVLKLLYAVESSNSNNVIQGIA
jgi:predicted dehydrogenase